VCRSNQCAAAAGTFSGAMLVNDQVLAVHRGRHHPRSDEPSMRRRLGSRRLSR
jgi:hypothetical protein